MKLEIAEVTIHYRNALELNEKVRKELGGVHERRMSLERECKGLRKKEKALERFLGNPGDQAPKSEIGGNYGN